MKVRARVKVAISTERSAPAAQPVPSICMPVLPADEPWVGVTRVTVGAAATV